MGARVSEILSGWDDLLLFDALTKGNWPALRELYDRYWNELFQTAYRKIQSREVAEELVQDLFINLWERREALDVKHPQGYLHTAIRYAVIDYIRLNARQSDFVEFQEAFSSLNYNALEEELSYNDLVYRVEDELRKMPEKTQEVFRLSRFEGQSIREISDQLSLTPKAIEYHLSKALKILRAHLGAIVFIIFS